jgi:hypothetical protein
MIYVYLVLSETAFVWPFKSFEVRNSFSPKLLVHKIDTTMFQMNKGARLHRTGHPIQIRVRWNRSGPVHETVRFTVPNRAYIFFIPTEPPVSPVYRPVFFFGSWEPVWGGLGNPAASTLYCP